VEKKLLNIFTCIIYKKDTFIERSIRSIYFPATSIGLFREILIREN